MEELAPEIEEELINRAPSEATHYMKMSRFYVYLYKSQVSGTWYYSFATVPMHMNMGIWWYSYKPNIFERLFKMKKIKRETI